MDLDDLFKPDYTVVLDENTLGAGLQHVNMYMYMHSDCLVCLASKFGDTVFAFNVLS